ncbi:MAG: hydrogenase 4 subunit B [Methylocella sp.]
MTVFALLAISLLLYLAGGVGSLLLGRSDRWAALVAGVSAAAGGVLGGAAALSVLINGSGSTLAMAGPFPFVSFSLRLDPLAALMVLVISIVTIPASIYSISYVKLYGGRGVGVMGFFLNLFIASMVMVAIVDNAFYFLLFWEMMTLASYFLVVFDEDQEAVDAGFLYFFIAHGFSMLAMIAFLLLFMQTGSLEFAAFRLAGPPTWLASVIFLLAFIGFGAKAGMMPLHVWLPRAHPAAPSHASALMSGVMIKFGIYGIIRVGMDFLGAGSAWWGWLVLAFGGVSAVLGVLYALAEHDIKRLLAYHSVENIGIILMGVGVGMIGMANHQPVVASLGLLAALYHLLNHATFKGLLFLGAGSVLYSVSTRDMGEMGGLGRRMPRTAVFFLVGALAISAIPPLNGFVSEWFTYQAFFALGGDAQFASRLLGPIAAVMLAFTGALAVMCFVKVWGLVFGGAARSVPAARAREVPRSMQVGMGGLALACVLLGLCAPLVAPLLSGVVSALIGAAQAPVASGAVVFPGDPNQAMLSTPLLAVMMLGLLAAPLLIAATYRGRRDQTRRISKDDWACGYQHTGQMSVSSAGFTEPLRGMFSWLYWLRASAAPVAHAGNASVEELTFLAKRVEPIWDRVTTSLTVGGSQFLGRHIQRFESGDLQIYCLYIFVALAAVLLAVVR